MSTRVPFRFVLAALLAAGCSSHAVRDDAHRDHHAHWQYEGAHGPAAWGELDAAYAACAAGRAQSPIDLAVASAPPAPVAPLAIHYRPLFARQVDNGHTVQDDLAAGADVELDGTRYQLAQFHFHSPSEHTVDGRHFPLEVHLVHRSAAGKLLVLGVLVEEGAHHPALGALFARLPRAGETEALTIDPSALLPADHGVVTYAGSLTTPPCTEGVTWRVFTSPITASADELAGFRTLYPHNNRPVMPLHGRVVAVDSP